MNAMLCTLAFLVYGGIEASIGAWVPVFATRYTAGPLAAAQWILSLFWFGLIVGRLFMAHFTSPSFEKTLLRTAIVASALCLLWFLAAPSFAQVAAAAAIMGVDETTFWWWESGKRAPRYPRTKAIVAEFLGNL